MKTLPTPPRLRVSARALSLSFFLSISFSLLAQFPVRWDAETSRPASADIQVMRGETLTLAPRLLLYGEPADLSGCSAALWFQTNGMGSAWWRAAASVSATETGRVEAVWSPTNDAGASAYTFFLAVTHPSAALSYRAAGRLVMRPSPGYDPAEAVPPSCYGDLASSLLPLILPSVPTYAAWTNEAAARIAGDADLQAQIDALDLGGNGTASQSDTALRLLSVDSNYWVSVVDAHATLYRHYVTNWVALAEEYSSVWPVTGGIQTFPFTSGVWTAFVATYNSAGKFASGDSVVHYAGGASAFDDRYWTAAPSLDEVVPMPGNYVGSGTSTLHQVSYGVSVGTYATTSDLSAAISAALAGYNPASATQALALAQTALGSATNAQASAAAVDARLTSATNAIIRTYFAASNAWIEVDFSNQTAAVVMVIDGATNSVTLSEEAGASIDPLATNLLWQALGLVSDSVAGKADKAWGKYLPDGSGNPEPDYMTMLNAPATLFGSGCSWATSGAYAVLLSTGTVAFASGSNGVFRIGPNFTNWFGYVTGGSVIVGAAADSITVHDGGTTNGYAEIDYAYTGGDYPVMWYTTSLAIDFSEVATAQWTDNLDGTATVTVPAPASSGFWKATTTASFDNYFETTMPCRFSGGVAGGTNGLPVVYDSVITISSGGHTYRIPAQLAD